MRFPARVAAWMLPLLLTACFHRSHKAQVQPAPPPLVTAPAPQPTPVELPPAAVTIPPEKPPVTAPVATAQLPQETPKPPVKHKKPAAKTTQQASAGAPGVSAIGQLSSGEPYDLRRQTSDSIQATERGLNGINRRLSDQEQKTAAQIREYLKQARLALGSGDVDGASTLAAKAKVLLGELNR